MGFNGYVIKEFGVENPKIQFGSILLSMLSIFRSFAARYAFVQHNKDPGFSINLAKSLGIFFLPILTLFMFLTKSWTDKSHLSILGVCQMLCFHPIFLLAVFGIRSCDDPRSSEPSIQIVLLLLSSIHSVFLYSIQLSSVPTRFLPLTVSVIVRVRGELVRLELEETC